MTSRVLVAAAGVALTLVVGALAAPAEAASVHRSLSLTASPSAVVTGAKVTLKGTVTRSPKGTNVRLQVRSGSSWKTIKTARTTTSSGRFSHTITSGRAGTYTYRARVAATKVTINGTRKTLQAKTSSQRKVTVKPKPVPPAVPPRRMAWVSQGVAGDPGNGDSYQWATRVGPSISSDGRYVAFSSEASNLVKGDTNGEDDVFLYDRVTGVNTRVSAAVDGGAYWAGISPDGLFVAYRTATKVYLWDRVRGTTSTVATVVNGSGGTPAVANGGAHVAFTDYGPEIGGSHWINVYVWSRSTGSTTLVSKQAGGSGVADEPSRSPAISADGAYVVYESDATDLVDGDDNERTDAFLWSRSSGTNRLMSSIVGSDSVRAGSGQPSISADGSTVAFAAYVPGSNGWQVYVAPRGSGSPVLVSRTPGGGVGGAWSQSPSVSADGSYVAFESDASDLAPPDVNVRDSGNGRDVFLWTRSTGSTVMVSPAPSDASSSRASEMAKVSADGRFVAFGSWRHDLVDGDTPDHSDIFLWDRDTAP